MYFNQHFVQNRCFLHSTFKNICVRSTYSWGTSVSGTYTYLAKTFDNNGGEGSAAAVLESSITDYVTNNQIADSPAENVKFSAYALSIAAGW